MTADDQIFGDHADCRWVNIKLRRDQVERIDLLKARLEEQLDCPVTTVSLYAQAVDHGLAVMDGGRTVTEKIESLPADRRKRIEKRAEQLAASPPSLPPGAAGSHQEGGVPEEVRMTKLKAVTVQHGSVVEDAAVHGFPQTTMFPSDADVSEGLFQKEWNGKKLVRGKMIGFVEVGGKDVYVLDPVTEVDTTPAT